MSTPNPFGSPGPVEIVAHRGYSARAPENTRSALSLAIDAGADAVEFDLHVTRDGVPVLLHDRTLNRTTDGTGPIEGRDAAELVGLDAGAWFGPEFRGESIPTLEEMARGVGQRAGRLYAEIKAYSDPGGLDEIVRIVTDTGLAERTVFISMDWEALDRVRIAAPCALIGYIVEHASRAPAATDRVAGDSRAMLDFDARVLLADPALARVAVDAGVRLATWTVNTVEQARALLELGVSHFTTNEVEKLVEWKSTL